MPRDEFMTITQFRWELRDPETDKPLALSTFNDWRAKKRAPRCIKLPNGSLRIRRSEFERWLDKCEEAA